MPDDLREPIDAAARSLRERLGCGVYPHYVADVLAGVREIVVYRQPHPMGREWPIPDTWQGVPVRVVDAAGSVARGSVGP